MKAAHPSIPLPSRRDAIRKSALIAATIASSVYAEPFQVDSKIPLTSMGLCQYCARFAKKRQSRDGLSTDLFRPENFFQHAKHLGAGGYQVELGILSTSRAIELRRQADDAGMYIEGIVKAPKTRADLERFDAEMKSAAAVGAKAVRSTIFSGRRYEVFPSRELYEEHDAQSRRSLELAAPIAEKYRVGFAPENHKDHRVDERVDALRRVSSEYVGVCVDTGNNFSLMEDPVDTARKLAPWALSVHLKDQAVQLYPDGFLFGDIPLGQGFIDLKKVVSVLQAAKPGIEFTLELLTRDPLRVPCLNPSYWRTFPEMPATDLATTLRTVRDNEADHLQYPSRLDLDDQVALEQNNVRQSIRYARDQLGLTHPTSIEP